MNSQISHLFLVVTGYSLGYTARHGFALGFAKASGLAQVGLHIAQDWGASLNVEFTNYPSTCADDPDPV